MKPNVAGLDRALRILIGLALMTWGAFSHNWLGAIGIAPVLTGWFRFCPAYTLLGISSCKK